MVEGSGRRELLVSTGWVQAAALTLIFGFFVLGMMGYKTYSGQPPIPEKVTDPAGSVVFTGGDVSVRAMDPWPHSEAGRFHRGISLVIAFMSVPILAAEALRNHVPPELAVLGAAFSASALVSWHLHAAFRAAPANFPAPRADPPRRPAGSSIHRKGEGAER